MESGCTEDFNDLAKIEIEVCGSEEDFESLASVVDEIVSEIDENSDEDCEIISYELPHDKHLKSFDEFSDSTPKQTNIISFFLKNKTDGNSHITFIPESPLVNNKRKREDATKQKPIKTPKLENGLPIASARKKKICPDYKRVPGTNFTVDAFSYGVIPECSAYFLSHFHADHYTGLGKKFSSSLYCTQTTANLVRVKIDVNPTHIHPLSLNTVHVLQGVEVVFLEANHCPGSVIIRFSTPDGKHYIHTGDFRGHPKMESYEALLGLEVDTLYLDTTYMNPIYTFPPQEEVISQAIAVCRDALKSDPNTLILVGSYLVGKERLYLGIAEALDCRICVSKSKLTLLNCYEWPELKERLTTDSRTSRLHVVKISSLSFQAVKFYKERFPSYTSVLAIRPTGWAFKKNQLLTQIKPIRYFNITTYDLPYSEHSSYNELKRFVKFIRPEKVVPTVNTCDFKNMKTIFDFWLSR